MRVGGWNWLSEQRRDIAYEDDELTSDSVNASPSE